MRTASTSTTRCPPGPWPRSPGPPAPPGTGGSPSAPTSLTSSSTTSSGTTLSWGASTGGSGTITYDIDRNGAQVGTTTRTSYTDTRLTPPPAYSYTVIATDTAGDTSPASSAVSVTTLASGGGGGISSGTWYQVVNTN